MTLLSTKHLILLRKYLLGQYKRKLDRLNNLKKIFLKWQKVPSIMIQNATSRYSAGNKKNYLDSATLLMAL